MTEQTQARPRAKRGDIQGLRALAVGLVVVAHAGVPGLDGGFVGVDVFFVLSGFLITGLLLAEGERTGRVSIASFYARRARRILPAATLVLLAVLAWAAWQEPVTRLESIRSDALWSSVFLANFHFASIGTDYFAVGAESPVQHYWSLAVEEQFYLVWPLIVLALLLVRARRRVLFGVLASLTVASLAWSVWLTHSSPIEAYFSSPARAHELGIGALLAMAAPYLAGMGDRLRNLLVVVGLAMVLAATLGYDATTAFPSWNALLPVLGTAALVAAGCGREAQLSRLLGRQPLRYLGDLSYSIYLWHWPVLILGEQYADTHLETAGLLVLTLVLSSLSYHFVEQPFQTGRVPKLAGKRFLVLWPASLALVLVGSQLATSYGDAALERSRQEAAAYYDKHPEALRSAQRTDIEKSLQDALRLADEGAPVPPQLKNLERLGRDVWQGPFRGCYASFPDTTAKICPAGDLEAERTVVVLGDSHAGMWAPAVTAIGKREGFTVLPILKVGCAPFDVPQRNKGTDYPECPEFRDWAMEQVREIRPDAIVVAHRGLLEVEGDSDEEREERWRDGVSETVAELVAITPVVKVLGDIPTAPAEPRDCLNEAGASLEDCVVAEEGAEIRSNPITREAATAAGADYVDSTSLICQQGRCPMVVGDVVTYRDKAHLSLSWTKIISRRLGELLRLTPPSR
ncbi:acyltransferase family protein [Nocardioides daejeonensis]|uniref:acyltransferase family protein n=1 Tax=Nocardioides daejeonensis TaxID=1046556 RepID=UPI0013A535F4|nr:acyltransferase family protein [Nocardioides daejeonensis]